MTKITINLLASLLLVTAVPSPKPNPKPWSPSAQPNLVASGNHCCDPMPPCPYCSPDPFK